MFTTGYCNLKCDYCGGSFEPNVVPWKPKVDIEKLKKIIESDPHPVVIFYGGEPLANPKFIMSVMDNVNASRWGVQTNGTLVKLLPENYWRRIDVALLSIDGRREITDKHRGNGVYDKVVKNAKYLKDIGVKELIARMTVTEDSDIYEEVTHLLSLGLFDKIHWQLNVDWTEMWDVKTWAYKSYLPGIRKLTNLFLEELSQGKILKIIPILGVISAHYFQPYRGSPCGAGYKSVAIKTDGTIIACPIAVREEWAILGDVAKGFRLLEDPIPDDRCKRCEFLRYCGGRCLYASKEKFWGEEGFNIIDEINKEYLRIVLEIIPDIEKLLTKGVIKKEDLYYDPTEDSTEVIP